MAKKQTAKKPVKKPAKKTPIKKEKLSNWARFTKWFWEN